MAREEREVTRCGFIQKQGARADAPSPVERGLQWRGPRTRRRLIALFAPCTRSLRFTALVMQSKAPRFRSTAVPLLPDRTGRTPRAGWAAPWTRTPTR